MSDQPLTKQEIEELLKQKGETLKAMIYVIENNIKQFKLPYKIEDEKLIEVGDSTEACLSRFVTNNSKMLQIKDDVRKLSISQEDKDQLFAVLITGPTGTGKELIARALHGDRVGDFIPI